MGRVVAMLYGQALTLQTIFTNLARKDHEIIFHSICHAQHRRNPPLGLCFSGAAVIGHRID